MKFLVMLFTLMAIGFVFWNVLMVSPSVVAVLLLIAFFVGPKFLKA